MAVALARPVECARSTRTTSPYCEKWRLKARSARRPSLFIRRMMNKQLGSTFESNWRLMDNVRACGRRRSFPRQAGSEISKHEASDAVPWRGGTLTTDKLVRLASTEPCCCAAILPANTAPASAPPASAVPACKLPGERHTAPGDETVAQKCWSSANRAFCCCSIRCLSHCAAWITSSSVALRIVSSRKHPCWTNATAVSRRFFILCAPFASSCKSTEAALTHSVDRCGK
mmetsp:Transcript_63358/g.167881  ORF Transcript_63358/g.167881 Transcript_63358/m.167881 type:complete len:230 (-) Transcript_63358:120-809(-)